jgi:fucose permease
VSRPPRARPAAAGIVGWVAFALIGWSGLLVPSLIRSIEDAFDQTDAGMGTFYLVYAVFYAIGSFGGGILTERIGRRAVLPAAAMLHGVGLIGLAVAPEWAVFLLAAVPAGLGAGGLDGGVNGLALDLYRESRGRALNLLHLFFSLGALTAPLAVGRLVEAGVDWHAVIEVTGLAAIVLAGLFLVVRMPNGRRVTDEDAALAGSAGSDGRSANLRTLLAGPLILLAVAIGCYVASEIGVSNWLVRFLEAQPLSVATTALALYWGGLALGRLVSARVSDRFDHTRFAVVASLAMSIALTGAILAPSGPLSIALFALSGFATGPVYPMIMAIGGDRYPDRSAAVSGLLSGAAVTGSIVYPPIMGLLSVTVGLTVAMLGTVVLGLACAAALVLVGRMPVRTHADRLDRDGLPSSVR